MVCIIGVRVAVTLDVFPQEQLEVSPNSAVISIRHKVEVSWHSMQLRLRRILVTLS